MTNKKKVVISSIIFFLKVYNYLKKNDYLTINGKIAFCLYLIIRDIISKILFYEIYIQWLTKVFEHLPWNTLLIIISIL